MTRARESPVGLLGGVAQRVLGRGHMKKARTRDRVRALSGREVLSYYR